MKTRGLSLLLALVMVLGLLSAPAQAAEGAEEISSQAQLAEMTDGGSYILTADIVLSEWQAISFSGSLDGNGHTITLSGTPLFDTLTGTVKNLLLDGSVRQQKRRRPGVQCDRRDRPKLLVRGQRQRGLYRHSGGICGQADRGRHQKLPFHQSAEIL